MYQYSVIQWLFFFYLYCFLGWCFESAYVSACSRKLTNRGFLRGPFLPIYGSGAIMMLVVSRPFQDNLILTYLAGCVGATALEYVTGVAMEALFKVRYWDYSKKKFQFQGHICLSSTLAWGAFTVLMTRVIHQPIEELVLSIPQTVLTVVTSILTVLLGVDLCISFRAAMDLRNLLVKLEQLREEMGHIQKRVDVVIALSKEELENKKAEFAETVAAQKAELAKNVSERKSEIADRRAEVTLTIRENRIELETKLAYARELIQERHDQRVEHHKKELQELKNKLVSLGESAEKLLNLKNIVQRSLVRSNPSMTSVKFKEALEELKARINEKKENDN